MGIEPEVEGNEDRSFGFSSAFRGYPIPKGASQEYRKGHKAYAETRKDAVKARVNCVSPTTG